MLELSFNPVPVVALATPARGWGMVVKELHDVDECSLILIIGTRHSFTKIVAENGLEETPGGDSLKDVAFQTRFRMSRELVGVEALLEFFFQMGLFCWSESNHLDLCPTWKKGQ